MQAVEGVVHFLGFGRLLALATLAIAAVQSYSATGWACSCGGEWTRADASVVFQGTAIEVHEPVHLKLRPRNAEKPPSFARRLLGGMSSTFDDDVRTTFRVNKIWKGQTPQFVTMNTGTGMCCDCTFGKVFEEGKDYVVYADQYNGQLWVGNCGGTAALASSVPRPELDQLGPGTPPPSGSRGFPMFWRHLLFPAALAFPIALAFVVQRFARRRAERSAE